ncbi:MRP-L47-domain-containing protein [Polychaeton citri CBS 116435]|uniref:Large ribosomal subunit protein uL29m n=1 Tax=Polychaeton citri CBS 116435 TaxID=1314669 RepID=A0A9P4Q7B9_9PEZI|nr:MRP-L47-domain-containing protein [Polychaeton citri CBS 116435]
MAHHTACSHALRTLFTSSVHRVNCPPPSFLLPAFRHGQTATFSTSEAQQARKDGNPKRGMSALYRRGLGKKQRLSVNPAKLPQPRLDPQLRSEVRVDEDHGLWDFFNKQRDAMMPVESLHLHGRGWTVAELRLKDWEDLHRLWWVCIKERNRLNTFISELQRTQAGYGQNEAEERLKDVKKTQIAIRHVLTERWYAWENARAVAMDDEEVDFYANPEKGEAYYNPKPSSFSDAFEQEDDSGRHAESLQPPLDTSSQRANEPATARS